MIHPFLSITEIYGLGLLAFIILLGFVALAIDFDFRRGGKA